MDTVLAPGYAEVSWAIKTSDPFSGGGGLLSRDSELGWRTLRTYQISGESIEQAHLCLELCLSGLYFSCACGERLILLKDFRALIECNQTVA